jgi:hypothetical protein
MQWIPFLHKGEGLIQVYIGGHPPILIGSSCPFLVQHVLLYFFVIVGYTLLGSLNPYTYSRWIMVASHLIQFVIFYFFMLAHIVVLPWTFWGP